MNRTKLRLSTLCIALALSGSAIFLLSKQVTYQSAAQTEFSHPNISVVSDSVKTSARADTFMSDTLEVLPLTTLEAGNLSQRIVLLKSKSSEVRKGIGGNIFTYTTFEVLQAIKGQPTGTELTLRMFGGRIGDVEVHSPITISFTLGDKFVLFLGKDNSEGYPTIIPQAIFAVRNSGGIEVVEPTPNRLPLFHAQGGQAYSGVPGNVPLDDFLFSLEKLR